MGGDSCFQDISGRVLQIDINSKIKVTVHIFFYENVFFLAIIYVREKFQFSYIVIHISPDVPAYGFRHKQQLILLVFHEGISVITKYLKTGKKQNAGNGYTRKSKYHIFPVYLFGFFEHA